MRNRRITLTVLILITAIAILDLWLGITPFFRLQGQNQIQINQEFSMDE